LLLSAVAGVALTALAPAPASAAGGPSITYRTYDVPGHQETWLEGINNKGDLAGQVLDGPAGGRSSLGFIARNGVVTVFDPSGTGAFTDWATLNENDTVAGAISDSNNVTYSFIRTSHGVVTTIIDPSASEAPGAPGTEAFTINDAGIVSGLYGDSNGVLHGFQWRNGAFTTFDAPGAGTAPGQGTVISSTTDAGVIIGAYSDSANVNHDFVDDHGRFTTFSFPGSQATLIAFISNNRHVIAGTFFDSSNVGRGFLLTSGGFTELSDPNANTAAFGGTWATAVDSQGNEVAGGYFDQSGTVHGWIGAF
jgi:hypothetical protein